MGRLIGELLPAAVVIENVPGISKKGRDHLDQFIRYLTFDLGYIASSAVLQVADYGVPQMRRRYVLVAGRGFPLTIPPPTHHKTGANRLMKWNTVASILSQPDQPDIYNRHKFVDGDNTVADWHVTRKISEKNRERLQHARPGGDWRDIPTALRPACHQGEYFGFRNVYGRMHIDKPSPAITSGCTTPSKGRFGHPSEPRTISIKEAAQIQQFPVDYRLNVDRIDDACSVIGNALPCGFAESLGKHVRTQLVAQLA